MSRHLALLIVLLTLLVFMLPAAISAQEATPVPGASQNNLTIHVVQRGETLFRIALRYGTTVAELAALNGITDPGSIFVGQRLLVPGSAASAPAAPQTHVVQPGETLRSIAELYGTNVEALAALNNIIDVNTIYVGQVLNISAPAAPTPFTQNTVTDQQPASNAPVLIHIVQPGETLFRIATRYGIAVNELASANGISDPSLIYAGQQLVIPGFEPPQLALDLPAPVTGLDVLPLVLIEGEAARIRVTTSESVTMGGTFLSRTLNVISEQNNRQHTMLIGVPLGTTSGVYTLSLTLFKADGIQVPLNINLQILAGGYSTENINLLAGRDNLLEPSVEQAELDIITRVMSSFSPQRYFDGPLGLPAAAAITSPFGVIRSYNGGEASRRHTGTDFAGAPGTSVLAPAPGIVVLADTLNVRGLATVIDHGWGVFTGYWHQAEQYVQVGETVASGQIIGTIGATGRVTGAHLHWELWVSGVPVDPMQWVRLSFP
ncbi:MAG: LysM peptidoglycan-binding domain-containing protein [Chloroflexi bacterium]|nr:LysM peptidoglycan-binding domain-containing protein [Chloroflexota bacterium]